MSITSGLIDESRLSAGFMDGILHHAARMPRTTLHCVPVSGQSQGQRPTHPDTLSAQAIDKRQDSVSPPGLGGLRNGSEAGTPSRS